MKEDVKNEQTREDLLDFAMRRINTKVRHYIQVDWVRECDADDLRQDVIVAVLEKMKEFDRKQKARERTFINTIVKNAFRYHFSNGHLMKNRPLEDIDFLTDETEPLVNVRSEGLTEEEKVDLRIDLRSFRASLSEMQRRVFDFLPGTSNTEIAIRLGLTPSRVGELRKEIQEEAKNSALKNYF